MVAWMNRDALERTLETGRTWFWSRSRQEYWCKGETSGDRQYVRDGVLRLRHGRAAVRRRAGGPRRVPHGRAQLLLPGVRQRRRARALVTALRRSGLRRDDFRDAGARLHGRAGLARGARRSRDAAVGVREARRRPRRLPARVGRARRALGPVLVPRPRSRRARSSRAAATSNGSAATRRPRRARRPGHARARSKRCSQRFRAPTLPELPPFHGGIVGWMGYDTVREIERLPAPPPDDLGFPDAVCSLAGQRRRVRPLPPAAVPHRERVPAARCRRRDARRDVRRRDRAARQRGRRSRRAAAVHARAPAAPTSSTSCPRCAATSRASAWAEAVNAAKEHILEGDIFQVVLAQRFDLVEPVDPLDVYRVLRLVNPSPYMYFLHHPGGDGRRFVARGAGAAARRSRDQPPDRGHAPARPQRGTRSPARGRAGRAPEGARRARDARRPRAQRRRAGSCATAPSRSRS